MPPSPTGPRLATTRSGELKESEAKTAPPAKRRSKRRSPRIYKNRRGELRRDEIFEILQCTLGAWGWDALNLRHVADAAGVSVGLIHHHFASRDAIARSFYEEVYGELARYFDDVERAPFADVFRGFIEYSVERHTFLDGAYADALRDSLRRRAPLPALDRVFALLVAKSIDLDAQRASAWLLEVVHQRLLESFLFTRNAAATVEAAVALTPLLFSVLSHPVAVDVQRLGKLIWKPATHLAGTPWHDQRVRRSLELGIPSQNPRRKRDARRRSGEGV
jgi:AcrR family transcriptional regulator